MTELPVYCESRSPPLCHAYMASPEDQPCFSCRVVGSGVCFGASMVLAGQLLRGVPPIGGPLHRAALTAFSAGFAALGVVRAVT